jgi:DNA repair protein RecN (Recombination protein N)
MALLDAYGQHHAQLAEVGASARRWAAIERELAELSRSGDVGDRLAFLEHQHGELARETLDGESIEEMLAAHRRQSNAAALLAAYDLALARLSGDDSGAPARSLHQIAAELSRQLDSESRLAEVSALLESAQIQIDEAGSLLERLRDDLDLDALHLGQLEGRLARLHELSRKHRVPLQGLAARRDEIGNALESLRGMGARGERLQAELQVAADDWRGSAAGLSALRQAAAAALGAAVSGLMDELGMAGGVFAIELQAQDEARPHVGGAERCEFLVSANPGHPARALRKVASGGELARISLAIEVAALGLDSVPSMIFDEVDSGIGGAVAEVVGQKLRALGGQRQVLCVTHLPQVAAQGHHHFQVSKAVNGSSTHSAVSRLGDKARIEELARMLGGVEITRETRANARQMLASAQK